MGRRRARPPIARVGDPLGAKWEPMVTGGSAKKTTGPTVAGVAVIAFDGA